VIGLPDLIGAFGLAAMDKVVGRAIGFFAINGEGLQILGDGANDVVDSVVARRIAALVTCDAADLPIDGGWTKGGPLQRQAFGEVAHPPDDGVSRDRPVRPGSGQPTQIAGTG
jgi:hypothetical protein